MAAVNGKPNDHFNIENSLQSKEIEVKKPNVKVEEAPKTVRGKTNARYSHTELLINRATDKAHKLQGHKSVNFDHVMRELSMIMCLHNHSGARLDHRQANELHALSPSKVKAHANAYKDLTTSLFNVGGAVVQVAAQVILFQSAGMAAGAAKIAAEAPAKVMEMIAGVLGATGQVTKNFSGADQTNKRFEADDVSRLAQETRADGTRKHERASQTLATLAESERARHDSMRQQ